MNFDWPTDDNVTTSNSKIAPSKLQGSYIKKRKQPEGGFDLPAKDFLTTIKDLDGHQDSSDSDNEEKIAHISKKHRSVEESAKIRPSRDRLLRRATKAVSTQKKSIDPRFMDYAGSFDKEILEKNYSFLDDIKKQEIDLLKTASKKSKDSTQKSELRRAIQSREESLRNKNRNAKKDELLAQYKAEQKEQAKAGIATKQINDKQLKKQLGMAQDFLSMSANQIDKRIKHKMERQTNRDKAEFRKQLGGNNNKKK